MLDWSSVMCVDYPISEIGWVCRVFTPHRDAMLPHNRELIIRISRMIFLILISLMLALIIGNLLLKPVSILRAAAKKIMEGDYSARTNIKRDDEIGLAAEAFDKMAESIEQWHNTKSQFYTNLSHELKTPLNVIFSSVQLIDNYKSALDPEHYQIKVPNQMKIIRQNCYRIMRLINNFIDISRHDSGFLKINPARYDIVKLIRDITMSVKRYAQAKEIELCFVSKLESRTLVCDPDMVERIMLNLISNAIKFTDKNGAITVRLEDEEGYLIISVSDNGIGIPMDKLNLIFERFKQADNSLMLNRDGSGIGLSLVKALVEAHGGAITVKSEMQKGSTFEIRLPAAAGTESSIQEQVSLEHDHSVLNSAGVISRINIEFSDIYSCTDEEIS
jgi:signal transduction histidine kinase